MNKLGSSISTIIGFVFLFIILYLFLGKVDIFLYNKAVDDCNRLARIETNDGKVKIGYPAANIYTECMQKMRK